MVFRCIHDLYTVMCAAIHKHKKGGRKSMKAKKIVALLLESVMTLSLMAVLRKLQILLLQTL